MRDSEVLARARDGLAGMHLDTPPEVIIARGRVAGSSLPPGRPCAVAERLPEPAVDYVRLQISATKA